MAETPPHQIRADAQTPPTPLHGAAYDNLYSPRRSMRLSQRNISRDLQNTPEAATSSLRSPRLRGTPASSRRASSNSHLDLPHSPRTSPKHKSTRRVQIFSPSSADFAPALPQHTTSSNAHQSLFASSNTTMNDGMLPTPIKTPRKRPVPKASNAARALFQDQPVIGDEIQPSPRRGRKNKRYNGFSLESFSADAEAGKGRIQIFTDSRDKVPQADTSEGNPFLEPPSAKQVSSRPVAGTSKRRKVSGEGRKDPQVEEAIKKNEGMVYVFRGKKVFRRFEDADEEEEVIDTEDLGLLEHTPNGNAAVRPLKTLTRRSIKPTRLFQTEEQKQARELEREDEAATEIEDDGELNDLDIPAPTPTASKASKATTTSKKRSLRSTMVDADDEATPEIAPGAAAGKGKEPRRKINSPFDSWKRVKAGSSAGSTQPSRGRKRGVEEALDEPEVDASEKKVRSN